MRDIVSRLLLSSHSPAQPIKFRTITPTDIEKIRRLRNENLPVLRQLKKISPFDQAKYFRGIEMQKSKDTLLFSVQKGRDWAGYAGLVHIDPRRRECEVSSLLVSEFKLHGDRSVFESEFKILHSHLIAMARLLGVRSVFAQVLPHRKDIVPLLTVMGFKLLPERPNFYKKLARGSNDSSFLELKTALTKKVEKDGD